MCINHLDNRVGYDYVHTGAYSCSMSILNGSFSYRQEVVYNPSAGDVMVKQTCIVWIRCKAIKTRFFTMFKDLITYLSKLVGVK